ncbi:MAG: hypothetical protein HQL60_01980 [Magnetococcales bacterium]|nr:hypothetical protein [Magnetococcales bacterium]
MTASEQLLLDFEPDPVFTLNNFIVGDNNRMAVNTLRALDRADYTSLTLVGDQGTGKTHLLQATVLAWRLKSGSTTAGYLDLIDEATPPSGSGDEKWLSHFLANRAHCHLVAVDNLEQLQESPMLQEGILYLFNQLRATGGHMLCASQTSLHHLTALRSDLSSRLLWGTEVKIPPPLEEELLNILHKMVADRQVRVETGLPQFLWLRLPRHVRDYTQALDQLNHVALRDQRPLTIHLAKEVLHL